MNGKSFCSDSFYLFIFIRERFMKTFYVFLVALMLVLGGMEQLVAQTTHLATNGPVNYTDPTAFTFPYTGTIYKTDTTHTVGIETTRLSAIYDWSHYVTYTNDSTKVTYKLQGYYNYTGQWVTLKTLGVDSLRNTYYVLRDTLQYFPDSIRVQIYGNAIASGGTYANGKLTTVKGVLKFLPRTN